MKKTIGTLLRTSVICLFCISLLTSTSYAWYTTYQEEGPGEGLARLTGNLTGAELGAQLSWNEAWDESWNVVEQDGNSEEAGVIFNYENWEPGYTQIRYLDLKNVGTKPLKYYLKVNETETFPVGVDIAKVIDVYFIEDIDRAVIKEDLETAKYAGTLAQVILASLDHDGVAHGSIESGDEKKAAIVLHMKETADNTYKGAYKKFDLKITISQFDVSNTTM